MKAYKSLTFFSVLLMLLVLIGFFNTYFKFIPDFPKNIGMAVHFHVIVMLLWVLMLILQPTLIRLKYFKLHRLSGKFGYPLAFLVVGSFILLLAQRFRLEQEANIALFENILIRMVSVITMLAFVTFYVLAMKNKSNMATHMRYMIGTGIAIILASLSRLLYFFKVNAIIAEFGTIIFVNCLIVALIIYDKKHKLAYQAYKTILAFHLLLAGYYLALLGLFSG